jgi:hypothetical protein
MTEHTCTCPCCGKSFSGDDPESARNSALAHMTGSTDADHRGIGYQKATTMIDADSSDSQPSTESVPSSESKLSTEAENQSSAEQSYSSDQSSPGGSRSSPPEPELEIDEDDVDDQDDRDRGGCPSCGDDGVPLEKIRGEVPDETVEYLTQIGDQFCPNCSTSETAEVW